MLIIKVQPIEQEINLIMAESFSPATRSNVLATAARVAIQEAEAVNHRALGHTPRHKVWVDRQEGAPLESVRPDGEIIAEFELITETLEWIREQLERHSPVKTGRYQKSHALFADGTMVSPGTRVPEAEEYVYINTVPYARKIERGFSSQAPDGVYQVVAILARRRFSNMAQISFTYRAGFGGPFATGWFGSQPPHGSKQRQPAIIVRPR